jgi:hypothetical protein
MDGNEGETYLDMENDAVGKAFGSPPVSAQVCLHLLFIHLLCFSATVFLDQNHVPDQTRN